MHLIKNDIVIYSVRKIIADSFVLSRLACLLREITVLKTCGQYEYCKKYGQIIKMIDSRESRPTRTKANSISDFINDRHGMTERAVSKSYIAVVNNVKFVGNNNGFFDEKYFIYHHKDWDKRGVKNYIPSYVYALSNKRSLINAKFQPKRFIDKGIPLLVAGAWNIFHFTFEAIVKLVIMDKYYADKTTPILLDENVKHDSRSMKFLELTNINHREIIWVKRNECIKIGEAIIPPILAWGTFDQKLLNMEGHGWILDENATRSVRELVLNNYKPTKKYNKVYVARGNNKRLVNEEELIAKLSANGFEIFYPDKASFENEVDCFSTANCLVTIAGAAITNIIYSKENLRLYQICPYEFQCATGVPISDVIPLKMTKIAATIIKKGTAMNLTTFKIEDTDIQKIISESADL